MKFVTIILALAISAGQAVRATPVPPPPEEGQAYQIRVRAPGTALDKCPISRVRGSSALGLTDYRSRETEPIAVNVIPAPGKSTYSLNLIGCKRANGLGMVTATSLPGTRRQMLEVIYAKSPSDIDIAPACRDRTCEADEWTYLDDFDGGKLKELRLEKKRGQWALFRDANQGKDYTLWWLEGGSASGNAMVEMVEIDLVPVD